MAAHSFAILECLVESFLFPDLKIFSYSLATKLCTVLGCLLVILGQYTRTIAMHTAGHSFSHIVKTKKESDHVLVKLAFTPGQDIQVILGSFGGQLALSYCF